MGIEYQLKVPPENWDALKHALNEHLRPLVLRIDPDAQADFPIAYVEMQEDAVYVCDTLTNSAIASEIMRGIVDLMLLYSPSVTIVRE